MTFNIQWYEKINSTNEFLKTEIINNHKIKNKTIISTFNQINGHGRLQRKWVSNYNSNLSFSIYLESDKANEKTPSLTMAAALAISDFIKSKNIPANVKWPNDVLVNQKKICGILSEYVVIPNKNINAIIIGIGININMNIEEASEIDQPATSLFIETGHQYSLKNTLSELCKYLEFWIQKWDLSGFRALKKEWIEQTGPVGRKISINDHNTIINGIFEGYGENGELLIKQKEDIIKIWSGEIKYEK